MAAEKILLAQDWKTGCYTEYTTQQGEVIKVATIKGFECIFANILNIVVRFAGIALFIMFLVGGFKYLTSGSGDPKKTQAAQQTLTYAIIGLVVILGAWIIFLLIKEFTGVDVLNFEIVTEQ